MKKIVKKPGKPAPARKVKPAPERKKFNITAILVVAAILLITFISYYPSLNNEFTNWDDPTYVTDNPLITSLQHENVSQIFSKPVSLNYHPVTMLSLAVNYHYSKLAPCPYHTTNLIFHLLNTLLLFVFIYILTRGNLIIPAIVALLFGIHPMHVESVAWISERKDVLYCFFFLAGLIFYLKYLDTRKYLYLLPALLVFALSLLSKAMAVSLPVVFFVLDYYRGRKFDWKSILEKIPFLAMSVIFGIIAINVQAQGAIAKPGVLTLFQKFCFASYGFWMYLVKLVVPFKLSTFYPYPRLTDGGSLPLIFYLSPVIALIVAGAVAISLRKTKVVLFGFLFFLATIALVLQLMPVGKAVMADRYTYVPYIGLFFMIGYGFNKLFENPKTAKALKYSCATVLAFFIVTMAYLGNAQTKVWKNSGTLWTQVIDNYPTSDVAYKNRGNFFGDLRETAKAMSDYNVLLANQEADGQIYGNMGNIYRMREEYQKAYEAYDKAVKMEPGYAIAYINRGIIFSILKKYDESLADFDKALQLGANPPKVIENRAFTWLYKGEVTNNPADYDKAFADFNYLVGQNPEDFNLYLNRGLTRFKISKFEEALKDFEYSVRLNPKYAGTYFNISVCYYKMNNFKKALEYGKQAKAMGYSVADNYLAELQQKAK
ncbi:MAG: tetratricopeptide repeat protein [Bacteroidia bacterium]|nr:tetratricopeptide repeat protein [Bacteroidia bacterium]